MKKYCFVLPAKVAMSRSTSEGTNAMKFATASKVRSPRAFSTSARSLMSATRERAPGSGTSRWPRLRTNTSMPRATHRRLHAALMFPVPPMNRTRMSEAPLPVPALGYTTRRHPEGLHLPSVRATVILRSSIPRVGDEGSLRESGRRDSSGGEPGTTPSE